MSEFPDLKFDLSQIELIQVGLPVNFNIVSNVVLDKSMFVITITSPGNKLVPLNVTYGKNIGCEFVPNEVGPYMMNFEYCNKLVLEKPIIIKSFDPYKVLITPATNGCVAKAVQFLVDATLAGEGDLFKTNLL